MQIACRNSTKMAPKKEKGQRDLNELKRELDLDEHKITLSDLYRRFKCDPTKVK